MVGIPSSTLGAYFSGRHTPQASAAESVRALLAAMGVRGESAEAWMTALRRVRATPGRRPRSAPPYRGLASFDTEDADVFFGRERQTTQILERIEALADQPGPSNGVLAVVGPSGAGKSSILRAGVAAAVATGRLDVSGRTWTCRVTTPHEYDTLAVDGNGETLVVIDQFEEVFTSLDPERRDAVLAGLSHGAAGRVVVVALRADFYADAALVPELLPALQHAQVLIGPMTPGEVRDAITRPARHAGAEVEDGLVELVLAELAPRAGGSADAHDQGVLPLLSHALLAAWERSDGLRLTLADYRATGGLDAAVQRTADQVFDDLTGAEQETARAIFLRLVNVDGDVLTTRRRMAADELDLVVEIDDRAPIRPRVLLGRFVASRLVTAGDGWYEISHEALLTAWPRLRDWIEVDRAGLITHRRMTEAAVDWMRARREPGLLLRGPRLELSEAWGRRHREVLNDLERDYLDTSVAARDAAVAAERRRLTRLRVLLTSTATLGLVAVVLALVFVQARDRADTARRAERAVRDSALSRAVAFQAAQLAASDPALAQQLALVAYRAAPTAQARAELVDQSAQPTITRVIGQTGPTALAVSSSRGIVAVSHAVSGTVELYSIAHGQVPRALGTISGTVGKQVFALAFDAAGGLLAVGGVTGTVGIWDVASPDRPRLAATVQPHFDGAVEALAISPDGRTLVAGSAGTVPLQRWSIAVPSRPQPLPVLAGVPAGVTVDAVAFSSDGRVLAESNSVGSVQMWHSPAARRPAVARRFDVGSAAVHGLAFDTSGTRLAAGDNYGVVKVWSTAAASQTPLVTLHGRTSGEVNVLGFSPDGSLLAAGSSDGDLRQWDTAGWQVRADTGNPGPVTGVAYVSRDRIASTAADGTLRLQHTGVPLLPASGSVFALVWSSNGQRLAVATNGDNGGVQLWNASDPGDPRRLGGLLRMPAPYDPVGGTGAITGNGRLVAAGNDQGRVALWDVTDPDHPRATTSPFLAGDGLIESLLFTPDGKVLAVGGNDGDVHLWDVSDPAHPRRLATMAEGNLVLGMAISADGRYLAAGNADDNTYLYRITDPAHPVRLATISGPHNYVWGVGFSPDGRTLAATNADDTTRVYDISRPTRPRMRGAPLIGPSDYVYAASFSPGGRRLAVASNDATVRIYKGSGTQRVPLETLRSAHAAVFALAYNPSGTVLAAGGRANDVTLWSTDATAYARRACRAAGSPVTRAEWALYVPDEPYDPPCR